MASRVRMEQGGALSSGYGTWIVTVDGKTVFQHTRYPFAKEAKKAAESLIAAGIEVTESDLTHEIKLLRDRKRYA